MESFSLASTGQRSFIFPNRIREIRVAYNKPATADQTKILSSQDANDVLRCKWSKARLGYIEEFKVILMDRGNNVLGIHHVSTGGVSGTVADPKVIFGAALKANASCIIVAHNHPSNNLKPSEADRKLTQKLKEAGQFLDLPLLDHMILAADSYFSFADEGIL